MVYHHGGRCKQLPGGQDPDQSGRGGEPSAGPRCSAGNGAASREAAGFIDSLSAPSHTAGNATLSQFDTHDSREDAGMQKALTAKLWIVVKLGSSGANFPSPA